MTAFLIVTVASLAFGAWALCREFKRLERANRYRRLNAEIVKVAEAFRKMGVAAKKATAGFDALIPARYVCREPGCFFVANDRNVIKAHAATLGHFGWERL